MTEFSKEQKEGSIRELRKRIAAREQLLERSLMKEEIEVIKKRIRRKFLKDADAELKAKQEDRILTKLYLSI